MMLRVGVFSIWNKYRLRLTPGFKVVTRAVVTMSPVAVQVHDSSSIYDKSLG